MSADQDSPHQLTPAIKASPDRTESPTSKNEKKVFVTQDAKSPNNLLKAPKEVHKKLNDLVDVICSSETRTKYD